MAVGAGAGDAPLAGAWVGIAVGGGDSAIAEGLGAGSETGCCWLVITAVAAPIATAIAAPTERPTGTREALDPVLELRSFIASLPNLG